MVLLHHRGGPHGDHWDWLLERPCQTGGKLLALRVLRRCDEPDFVACDAQLMEDHRPIYLTFEGELSGNRGHVSRVATGEVLSIREEPEAITLHARWHAHATPRVWRCTRDATNANADAWRVQLMPTQTR